jgi:ribonuclease HII
VWEIEKSIFDKGIELIAGVDEAGRGPLAGPVVAAAVIIPKGYEFKSKISDSKKLTSLQRQKAYDEIVFTCCYAFFVIGPKKIDEINILQASLSAMSQAVKNLSKKPQWLLIDGPHKPEIDIPAQAIINGDAKSISIASASIIAKVVRDNMMLDFDKEYPEYGFAAHKGYGTKSHRQAIIEHGPCPIHRKTFQPIRSMLQS